MENAFILKGKEREAFISSKMITSLRSLEILKIILLKAGISVHV